MPRRLTDTPPPWASRYIGIDFAEHGRTREDGGLDCWGLVRLVYLERFGVELPSYADRYDDTRDGAAIAGVVTEAKAADWQAVDDLRLADVVDFRIAGDESHVGLMVARDRFLHCARGVGSGIERLSSPLWQPRTVGFYRYAGPVRVLARRRLFGSERIDHAMPAGATVQDLLAAIAMPELPHVGVWIGDRRVPREAYARVRPKAGQVVRVALVPQGGEDGSKTAARLVLTIAIVAAASFAGAGATAALLEAGKGAVYASIGGALLSAGIGIAGTLAVNALIPPPNPKVAEAAATGTRPGITGSRNDIRRFGTIPTVLGTHRIVPPFGAPPYTEIIADEQYLRMIFAVRGPLEMTDLRIGDTLLDDFQGVEVEIRQGLPGEDPITLYPDTVIEEPLSLELVATDPPQVRTSAEDAVELSVDVTFPAGLVRISTEGEKQERTVQVRVEYAPAGTGSYRTIEAEGPASRREMDFLFRAPEATFGGQGENHSRVAWGLGFPDPKPSYLPSTGYSWRLEVWVFVEEAGTYEFGLDCSDAGDLEVAGQMLASFYGDHGTAGGATPDFAAHSGSIELGIGFHKMVLRVHAHQTTGAVALGWKKPGGSWEIIPEDNLSWYAPSVTGLPLTSSIDGHYRWYDVADYGSTITVTAASTEPIRRSKAWAVPEGQYDVRLTRLTPESDDDRVSDLVGWTALRSFRNGEPITEPGLAKVAMRIKATDQLNGVVEQFNCLATSIVQDWDTPSLRWVQRPSNNPASLYRHILQSNARPLTDDRIDLADIAEWHARCEEDGWAFGGIYQDAGTVYDRLRDVAAAGRATPAMKDGKHTIVRDAPQTVPVQHFTPRNSRGFRGRRAFPEEFHALRILFADETRGYDAGERVVLDDGYQIDGKDAFGNDAPELPEATKFDTLELFGITNPDLAWRHGRYFIAVNRLRPEVYELSTDVEHLICNRGDLVLVTHDVPQWGLGFGRIARLVRDDSDNVHKLVLDSDVVMDAGDSYVIRVRLPDGTSWVVPIVTEEGVTDTLTLSQPVADTDPHPEAGDLYMFGRQGSETRELIVRAIDIDRDLGATLTLVDHAPAVHDADTGEIPAWDPGTSQDPVYQDRPETPVIVDIRSDEFVMLRALDGTLIPRILITLRPQSGTRPIATLAQIRTRVKPPAGDPGGPYTTHPLVPLSANTLVINNVEEGGTYQIRLRTVTELGKLSEWVDTEHTVVGKSSPPPDVLTASVVRLSDGTRRYTWTFDGAPPDLAGVRIRYGPTDRTWDQMTALHSGILEASPFESNDPPAGTWKFGFRGVDTSGNESGNVTYVVVTLGPPRLTDQAYGEDAAALGWPGTKTSCFVNAQGHLEANDAATWSSIPPSWSTWTRWNLTPASPILYEHKADAGFEFEFSPDAFVDADGDVSLEVAWSSDDVSYTDFVPIEAARTETVTARYLKVRMAIAQNGGSPVPYARSLVVRFRARQLYWHHDDLDTSTLTGAKRIGVGDVRLPVPAGMFSVIQGIVLSFNGSGAGATWEIVDKDVNQGPRIRIYDFEGDPQDAVIDAVIRGLA